MKSSRWTKAVLGVIASMAVLSANGVASATWTNKSGSGNGAAGAVSLGAPASWSATCKSTSTQASADGAIVNFSWSAVPGAGGYVISDSTTSNGTYSPIVTVSGGSVTSSSYAFTSSANEYFEIKATAGNSWVGSASSAAGPRTVNRSGNSSNYTCS